MCRIFTLLTVCLLTVSALQAQPLFSADFEGDNANAMVGGEWVISGNNVSQFFPIPAHTVYASVNDDDLGQGVSGNGDLTFSDTIDLTNVTLAVVNFESFFPNLDYQGADETADFIISTDFGATWATHGEIPTSEEWVAGAISLADFAGEQVQIGFRYTDGNEWNYGFAVDDIVVEELNGFNLALTSIDVNRYYPINVDAQISATVMNTNAMNITSFDVTWSDGTNTYTQSVTGVDIAYNESYDFMLDDALNLPEAVTYDGLTVEVSNINGMMDDDATDNSTTFVVSGLTSIPTKRMVVEEGTGTWCGWCPRGHVFMKEMEETYGDAFVGVAVHNGDPMAISDYDGPFSSNISGYPSTLVNRLGEVDPSQLGDVADAIFEELSPIDPDVAATLDVATKTLTVNGTAAMRTQADNLDFRFTTVLLEDEVTGTGSGYAQVNYYDGGGAGALEGAGLDWTTAGDPVPASQMVYEDVARAIIGGYDGEPNSFPTSMAADEVANYDNEVAFPDNSWNPRHMRAAVFIINNEDGAVLNAKDAMVSIVCPTESSATLTVADNTDAGTPNGAISVTDNGLGIAPFTYAWADGSTGADLTGLFPGVYELMITDNAGCTQMVSAEVQGLTDVNDLNGVSRFSVTPNPARGLTTLQVSFNQARDVQVGLYDLMGRQLQNFQYANVAQINQAFDLTALSTGTYLVKVQSDDQVRTERIQVVR